MRRSALATLAWKQRSTLWLLPPSLRLPLLLPMLPHTTSGLLLPCGVLAGQELVLGSVLRHGLRIACSTLSLRYRCGCGCTWPCLAAKAPAGTDGRMGDFAALCSTATAFMLAAVPLEAGLFGDTMQAARS